ncbi:FxSxx-COOH system tetratricopeptide repeat protein [Dactylosporangium sp. NPDC006015]|uniref:FxSxx-COOH system tetratricopeptide repeat protein n=1 Tax=Dactylosporangium sp. NPDC006015 TaxID=3154576 RepID=UPI0033A5725B
MDLFVSYAGPDRAWAEWMVWHLRAGGYTVELDVWDWAAGDNVVLRMSDALDRADRVLALWSPTYFERDRFTTDEWTSVMGQRPDGTGQRRLVPIRVAEVIPPSVLAPLVYRDVFGLNEEQSKTVLLDAVRGPRDASGRPEFPGTGKRKPPRDAAPRLPGVLPTVWNVPRRNTAFTGRAAHLVELRQQLCRGSTAVVQALHGFGGIGKTTLAIEYAHRFAGSYELVWWINAEQAALIGEQFTALGTEAAWVSGEAPTPNPVALVLQRLRVETGWLLIFDNAENRADLLPWLPQGAGHVLITSRNPGWDQAARPVPLPEFTRAESTALLRASVPALAEDRADWLADRLGDLPLAIAQAAQTLADTGLTVSDYLDLLDKQTVEILSDGTPVGYPVPLAAVVRTAMQRLTEKDSAAAQLLQLCAFLGPEPIPTDLFTDAPPATLRQPLAGAAASVLALARIIRSIGGYGLARIGEGTLQLHRLTQAIIRDIIAPTDREHLRAAAEEIVASTADLDDGRNPEHWPRWAALLPHILALDPATSDNIQFRELACHASSYLISRGDIEAGREFADQLHATWVQRLGLDDPQALFAATNVAGANNDLGRYADAYRLDRQIYARRRALLGDDHPDTLVSAGNLAGTLRDLGRHGEALALNQDTYARRRRVLGEDHPDTLISAGNLAGTLNHLGRRGEALALHQDTYARLRRVLGDGHPHTLTSAGNLGNTLDRLGRHGEALALNQDTYARLRRVLGDDHPDTLTSAGILASTLSYLGRHSEALALRRDTHTRLRRVLGDDHPRTLQSAKGLARTLHRLGRTYDAQHLEKWIRRHTPPPDQAIATGEDRDR